VRTLDKFSEFDRKHLVNSVDAFIYMSKAIEEVYQSLGVPAHKGQIIYDGFDATNYEQISQKHVAELRAEFGLSDRDYLISNVGRLASWKGHDYFLPAMAEVIRSQPNAKALIVGEADRRPWNQAYSQKLRQMVAELHLSDNVIFAGLRSDIPQIMAASDIVVHSASVPEPFGRVVVEAMMAGKPVIATAAGGVLDSVEDQKTGLLVPLKDSEKMAKAIQQLIQDREQAKVMGQQAKQRAQELFSLERHAKLVQSIYQQILD
jgi:glycosyltransferase involved in cell wall biosynthesis